MSAYRKEDSLASRIVAVLRKAYPRQLTAAYIAKATETGVGEMSGVLHSLVRAFRVQKFVGKPTTYTLGVAERRKDTTESRSTE